MAGDPRTKTPKSMQTGGQMQLSLHLSTRSVVDCTHSPVTYLSKPRGCLRLSRGCGLKAIGEFKVQSALFLLRQVNNRQAQHKGQQNGQHQQQQPAHPPDFHQPQRTGEGEHDPSTAFHFAPAATRDAAASGAGRDRTRSGAAASDESAAKSGRSTRRPTAGTAWSAAAAAPRPTSPAPPPASLK